MILHYSQTLNLHIPVLKSQYRVLGVSGSQSCRETEFMLSYYDIRCIIELEYEFVKGGYLGE